MLVRADGGLETVRDYDVNGQLLSEWSHTTDPFGFTGGLDSGNGLWKLGARFYDSSKSSFIQQDRYMGDPSDPLSLNRYVYCGMDPVNFVDPTGFSKVISQISTTYKLTNREKFNNYVHNLDKNNTTIGWVGTFGSIGLGLIPGLGNLISTITGLATQSITSETSSQISNLNDILKSSTFTITETVSEETGGYEDTGFYTVQYSTYSVTSNDEQGNTYTNEINYGDYLELVGDSEIN